MRPAARAKDAVTCPLHVGGVIVPPCAPTVLVNNFPQARMSDATLCTTPPAPGIVTGGTTETVVVYLGATRQTESVAHPGATITSGSPDVFIGKVLFVRVVIVAGSAWDTPAGRANIAQQIRNSEAIEGMRIITGPYETVTDPTLSSFPASPFPGGTAPQYSPQAVSAINRYGAPGRPAYIFTNPYTPTPGASTPDAETVSPAWATPADGLRNEGVIYGPASQADPYVVAHENGHLLSRQAGGNTHNTTNRNDVMWPWTGQRGPGWSDPWQSATEQNPNLR